MFNEEFKKVAEELAYKIKIANEQESKLRQTRQKAQFPAPARKEMVREAMSRDRSGAVITQGAGAVYNTTEVEIPGGPDILDDLKKKIQDEKGQAYLEGRQPNISAIEQDITDIEGARSAISFLEEHLEITRKDIEDLRLRVKRLLIPMFGDLFDEAEEAYERALEGVRASFGQMWGVVRAAHQFGAGNIVEARFDAYAYHTSTRGLSRRINTQGHFAVVNWFEDRNGFPGAGAHMDQILGDLAANGIEP